MGIARRLRQSISKTYIERDVRAMLRIASLSDFGRFIRVAASRVGQLLNMSDIAKDVGVAVSTVGEWIAMWR